VLEKHLKTNKKSWKIHFGIFAKKFDAQDVQEVKFSGVISEKEAKNEEK
jgi:hypothetical protein